MQYNYIIATTNRSVSLSANPLVGLRLPER